MYNVYVLKSLRNGKRYIGFTGKEVRERLREHNNGTNKWTRANGPFEIVYEESYNTKTESIRREYFLKSGQGRKWLDITLSGCGAIG